MLDLHAQYATVASDVRAALERVIDSQHFILGPEVEALEQEIAAYSRVKHAIGVSSGTDALLLALMTLGVGPGDEIITTPYTFVATCSVIARLGARAVFVDIDPRTFDIDTARIEGAITSRTKAILPVHLFGQMADMRTVMEIARARNIAVIEDAAQALGAERDGIRAGAAGTMGTYSFFPSKNLGAFGDAGMVVTNDDALADRLRLLRNQGQEPKYFSVAVGGNFRLDAIQAAILRAKLPHLDSWSDARRRNALRYRTLFEQAVARGWVTLPTELAGRHVYHQFVVRAAQRDDLRRFLIERSIGCEVYYPQPMHLQECFAHWGHRAGDFPEAERAAAESLAIPIYPELTEEMMATVVDEIVAFYRAREDGSSSGGGRPP